MPPRTGARPDAYMTWVLASGGAWTLAYVIYVVVYWPILTGLEARWPGA